jgi:hypothetical protein
MAGLKSATTFVATDLRRIRGRGCGDMAGFTGQDWPLVVHGNATSSGVYEHVDTTEEASDGQLPANPV